MKILFVINHMNVGGIQKSLIELLKVLSRNPEYDVTLFCCKRTGAFLNQVPTKVEILPENMYAVVTETPLSECKKLGLKYYTTRLVFSLWTKIFGKNISGKIICKLIGKIGDNYDIAISYSQPVEDHQFCNLTNEIVLKSILADNKFTYVHCDFGLYGGNTKHNRKMYRKFDKIVAVSESVGKRFEEIVPEVSEKIRVMYNCCDCVEIIKLSAQESIMYNGMTFVTVARLSEEKGILRSIPIFGRLKEEGFDFKWYIIGGGLMSNLIRKVIDNNSLSQYVFLEGEQINPYRYMKNANYFLLTSYHEAAPMVYDEAAALGIPVLTTKTLSAIEMIERRGLGIVCENDEISIYNMLKKVMTDNIDFKIMVDSNDKICIEQFKALYEKS